MVFFAWVGSPEKPGDHEPPLRSELFSAEQMEQHFFGAGAEMPSGYVPPKT